MIIGVADRFEDFQSGRNIAGKKEKNSFGTSILVRPVKPDLVAAEKFEHARARGLSEAITSLLRLGERNWTKLHQVARGMHKIGDALPHFFDSPCVWYRTIGQSEIRVIQDRRDPCGSLSVGSSLLI